MTRPASIEGVFGASGSGKSAYIKQRIARVPAPLLIFDPGCEYVGPAVFSDEQKMYEFINKGGGALIFRPAMELESRTRQFGRFCLAALAVARNRGRCTVVIDELHTVTGPGRATAGWTELTMTGRKHGVSIIAASIRPASIDKEFWTCCTMVRSGRLLYEDDQRTVARALNVDAGELAALKSPPGAPGCDYIERDMLTGVTSRGRLTF